MKKLALLLLCCVFAAVVGGCNGEKLTDASSPDKFAKSLDDMGKSLKGEKQKIFIECADALLYGTEYYAYNNAVLPGNPYVEKYDLEEELDIYGEGYDKLTANQFLTKSIKNLEFNISMANKDADELEQKKAVAHSAAEGLNQFKILNAKFYVYSNNFISFPIVEMTIKNDTDYVVSRAYFYATVYTPGRTIPWHEGEISYSFKGGIEKGETIEMDTSPSRPGWASIPDRDDISVKVEVLKLLDEKDEVVLDKDFSAKDAENLVNLQEYVKTTTAKIEKIQAVLN